MFYHIRPPKSWPLPVITSIFLIVEISCQLMCFTGV